MFLISHLLTRVLHKAQTITAILTLKRYPWTCSHIRCRALRPAVNTTAKDLLNNKFTTNNHRHNKWDPYQVRATPEGSTSLSFLTEWETLWFIALLVVQGESAALQPRNTGKPEYILIDIITASERVRLLQGISYMLSL